MAERLTYPTTVTGLVAEIETNGADALLMADAFADLAKRLRPSLQLTGRHVTRPTVTGQRRTRTASYTAATAAVLAAADLAQKLSDALRATPDILRALKPLTLSVPPVAARTGPLYAPDDNDTRAIRNLSTGEIYAEDPWALILPWWPRLPAAAADSGLSLGEVAPDALRIVGCRCEHYAGTVTRAESSPWGELIVSANTVQLVRGREVGLDQLARKIRGGASGSRPPRGDARRAVRAAANRYQEWNAFLRPLVDVLAARYGQYISTVTAALHALSATEGIELPTVTTAPAVITDLATRIRAAIDSGHGGRLVVSDSEVAFAWAPGPATTLLSFLAQGTVTGRRTTVVTARDAATVVGPVAEGAAKPMVVDFSSEDVNLSKYPGQATLTVEAAQFTQNIETAVATVITGQIVRAIESDAADVIETAAGVDITAAASMTSGVLAAIAGIRGNGGSPNVVGLAADDWIDIMEATGAGGYLNFSNPEAGPAGTWLGLAPVIVPGLVAGNAIVADGRSVTVSEPKGGPLCIVDPFTQAANNKIIITVEAWAVPAVTSPGGVATVAVAVTP